MSFGLGAWLLGVAHQNNTAPGPPPTPTPRPNQWGTYSAVIGDELTAPYPVRDDNLRLAKNVWLEWARAGKREEENPLEALNYLVGDQRHSIHNEAQTLREWDTYRAQE